MCMLNPHDIRCIVGVRQVEDGYGPEGRLKRLLDGPPLPPLKDSTPVPVPVVGIGRTAGKDDRKDDERWWYNENTSGNTNRPTDVLTISDGRSAILSRLSQPGGPLEAVVFTILFGVFSAWFLWKRVGVKGSEKRTSVVEEEDHHRPETHMEHDRESTSLMINGTSQNTLLDNAVHPMISPLPPPVIMNGHADHMNDIMNTPVSIPPPTPLTSNEFSISLSHNAPLPISRTSTPLVPPIPLPSTPTAAAAPGATDDNEDSDAEGDVENGVGGVATPGKRKARRGKRGKKKKPGVLGGDEGIGGGSDKVEKGKADKDPEGEEKSPSLVLTTSSPKISATPEPSLIVSDVVLGMFPFFVF